MFEKSFLILVVALLVLGPQRLMYVARFMGVHFGRMRSQLEQLKQEVAEQMAPIEELKKDLGEVGAIEGILTPDWLQQADASMHGGSDAWGALEQDEAIKRAIAQSNQSAQRVCAGLDCESANEKGSGARISKKRQRAWRVYKSLQVQRKLH